MGGTIEVGTPHNIERKDRAKCGKDTELHWRGDTTHTFLRVRPIRFWENHILGGWGHRSTYFVGVRTPYNNEKLSCGWVGGGPS